VPLIRTGQLRAATSCIYAPSRQRCGAVGHWTYLEWSPMDFTPDPSDDRVFE